MELANKVVVVENVPFAHSTLNENYLYFPPKELQESFKTMEHKPVVINLDGSSDTDHAISSSMNTVGWTKNPRIQKVGDVWEAVCDVELTRPEVGEMVLRKTTEGTRELNAVSMGATMEPLCSICGSAMIASHDHERGQTYDGRLAYAIANKTEFNHLALTNFQADKQSTLDNSRVYEMETAVFKVKKWKVKEMAQNANIAAQAPTGMSPQDNGNALESRVAKLEEMYNAMQKKYPMGESADVLKDGIEDTMPKVKAGIPKEEVLADAQPPAVETPKDEEKEKKKMLEQYAEKYKRNLVSELAQRTGKSMNEFASYSIENLEVMNSVAADFASKNAGVSPKFGIGVEKSVSKKSAFSSLTAMERAEKYGKHRALEMAYKADLGQEIKE